MTRVVFKMELFIGFIFERMAEVIYLPVRI
jgi:hypothetical protein